jgi:hypothetical protein
MVVWAQALGLSAAWGAVLQGALHMLWLPVALGLVLGGAAWLARVYAWTLAHVMLLWLSSAICWAAVADWGGFSTSPPVGSAVRELIRMLSCIA